MLNNLKASRNLAPQPNQVVLLSLSNQILPSYPHQLHFMLEENMHWKPNPTNPSTNPTPPPTIPTSEKWLKVNVPVLGGSEFFQCKHPKKHIFRWFLSWKLVSAVIYLRLVGSKLWLPSEAPHCFGGFKFQNTKGITHPTHLDFFGSCKIMAQGAPQKNSWVIGSWGLNLKGDHFIGMQSWLPKCKLHLPSPIASSKGASKSRKPFVGNAVVKRATPKENLHLNVLKQGQTLQFHTPSNHVWFVIRAGGCFLGTLHVYLQTTSYFLVRVGALLFWQYWRLVATKTHEMTDDCKPFVWKRWEKQGDNRIFQGWKQIHLDCTNDSKHSMLDARIVLQFLENLEPRRHTQRTNSCNILSLIGNLMTRFATDKQSWTITIQLLYAPVDCGNLAVLPCASTVMRTQLAHQ